PCILDTILERIGFGKFFLNLQPLPVHTKACMRHSIIGFLIFAAEGKGNAVRRFADGSPDHLFFYIRSGESIRARLGGISIADSEVPCKKARDGKKYGRPVKNCWHTPPPFNAM